MDKNEIGSSFEYKCGSVRAMVVCSCVRGDLMFLDSPRPLPLSARIEVSADVSPSDLERRKSCDVSPGAQPISCREIHTQK